MGKIERRDQIRADVGGAVASSMGKSGLTMLLIDTNIFLELLLGQERADRCQKFLEMVSEGGLEAVATKFSIHMIEAMLNDSELIPIFLRNLRNSIGLHVYETSMDDEIAASMLIKKLKLDFDDGLRYYVAKKLGVKAIVSCGEHFDKTDIQRKEHQTSSRSLNFIAPSLVRC
ncbi:PIN domain nuclease [Candidatus Bathyarchaeota archaeon]|nr:MAG: PIN domain nuclease [Candidatus Bathyarchaeota archaeon]RLI39955.1 MAG: PIN domain nuclease [Candidatus Bathyarchaeota archaeon]